MSDNFFSLPKEIQNKIITTASYKLNLSPTVVEKDLWACWALATLFSIKLPMPMVFKGGTSLSKCYQLIRRFSEDLDITLDCRSLKKLDQPIENYTKTFLKKVASELKTLVKENVHEIILPGFEQTIKNMETTINDSLIKIEVSEDGENLRLYYPSVFDQQNHYLPSSILIEFGGRNVTEPNTTHIVKPYLASYVTDLNLPEAKINVLSPLRTFWEKVTLIHVECHRGRLGNNPERLSRHWYDLAMMTETDIANQALADGQLMVDVIRNKQAFFNTSYANYNKCLIKQFRIIPEEQELKALHQDFKIMEDAGMFYGEMPDFNKCIDLLRNLENRLNG